MCHVWYNVDMLFMKCTDLTLFFCSDMKGYVVGSGKRTKEIKLLLENEENHSIQMY